MRIFEITYLKKDFSRRQSSFFRFVFSHKYKKRRKVDSRKALLVAVSRRKTERKKTRQREEKEKKAKERKRGKEEERKSIDKITEIDRIKNKGDKTTETCRTENKKAT